MIAVNSTKPKLIAEKFDGLQRDGISFKVHKIIGMSVILDIDGDIAKAKKMIPGIAKEIPEFKYIFAHPMEVDENGRVI